MSGRDFDSSSDPKKPARLRLGFLRRTKAMSSGGSSGWEATTIGFTLVGCIGACSGLGYWLDNHFKTGYWLPILFLVGAVAGFREMLLVVNRISKEEAQKKLEKERNVNLAPNPMTQVATENAPRERVFQVPPPPTLDQTKAKPMSDAETMDSDESVEDLIERLSQQSRDEDETDAPK